MVHYQYFDGGNKKSASSLSDADRLQQSRSHAQTESYVVRCYNISLVYHSLVAQPLKVKWWEPKPAERRRIEAMARNPHMAWIEYVELRC